MSTLKTTIEFIALNDNPGAPESSLGETDKEIISNLEGWLSVATAAVALDRTPNEIASRVLTYRRKQIHSASSRRIKPTA